MALVNTAAFVRLWKRLFKCREDLIFFFSFFGGLFSWFFSDVPKDIAPISPAARSILNELRWELKMCLLPRPIQGSTNKTAYDSGKFGQSLCLCLCSSSQSTSVTTFKSRSLFFSGHHAEQSLTSISKAHWFPVGVPLRQKPDIAFESFFLSSIHYKPLWSQNMLHNPNDSAFIWWLRAQCTERKNNLH